MNTDPDSEIWSYHYDSPELAHLRRDASLSFREKLIWLEEATKFVKKLQAAKRQAMSSPSNE
jgi:hypothetical protein